MDSRDIYRIKAEADTRHLLAKLDEAEADALEIIAKNEEKNLKLHEEVKACNDKRDTLKDKFERMKRADDSSWDKANDDFIEAVEALEDKSAFRSKSETWFKNIRNTATHFKQGLKEKLVHK